MLRIGFVGAGNHATNAIYPSLRFAPIELVAVADLDTSLAERNARQFSGGAEVYGDHRELLDQADVDAVFVVGQPRMHVEVGVDVLEAGKHLFIEKPAGSTLEDALRLRKAAQSADRQVMVGFMKRFARSYARAKELTQTETFGNLRLLQLEYSHVRWADLRDHLTFMSVHPYDTARFFLGDVVDGIVVRRRYDDGDVLTCELEHAGGGISQLNLSACAPRVQESLDLFGANTKIEVRNFTELTYHRTASSFADAMNTDESMAQFWAADMTIPGPSTDSLTLQGYAGEVRHFADAILAGEQVTPNIDDGVETMRFVEAVMSAPEGISRLELPEV